MSRLTTTFVLIATFLAGVLLRDQAVALYQYAASFVPYRLAVVQQPAPRPPPGTVGRLVNKY